MAAATSNLSFFQAAATVIPVLFLALVVQIRSYESAATSSDVLRGAAVLLAAAYGEFVAFDVLSDGKAQTSDTVLVAVGVSVLAVDVVWEGVSRILTGYATKNGTVPRWHLVAIGAASLAFCSAALLRLLDVI